MKRKHYVGDESEMPKAFCLNCGHEFTLSSGVDNNSKPSPGCIAVCIECGHVMAFTRNMTMRALTDAEMEGVAGNESILAIQRARSQIKWN